MTDEELSTLLRQWERTPAPPSLDARVSNARKHQHWIFPAPAAALAGAAAGVLGVLGVLRLIVAPTHAPTPPPALEQTAQVAQPAKPTLPRVAPAPPTPAVHLKPKAKPIVQAAPPAVELNTEAAIQKRLFAPLPVYPEDARAALVEGTVQVHVRIGKDGHVIEANAIGGDPLLADAAVESAKQWLFQPTVLNGQLVEVITQIEVNFTLLPAKPRPATARKR